MVDRRPDQAVLTCAYCGVGFTASPDARSRPLYCSRSHRQRAFEARQVDVQLAELRVRIRLLELRNRRLRRQLSELGVEPDSG